MAQGLTLAGIPGTLLDPELTSKRTSYFWTNPKAWRVGEDHLCFRIHGGQPLWPVPIKGLVDKK